MALFQTVRQNRIILHADKQEVHSAEIGALASVFEKSATEPQPKPKLLRIVNILTFNVKTLNTVNMG